MVTLHQALAVPLSSQRRLPKLSRGLALEDVVIEDILWTDSCPAFLFSHGRLSWLCQLSSTTLNML